MHGFCLAGGSELATCCDLVYMADDAEMGYPAVRFGVVAMFVSAVVLVICSTMAVYLKKINRRANSEFLRIDQKNWLIAATGQARWLNSQCFGHNTNQGVSPPRSAATNRTSTTPKRATPRRRSCGRRNTLATMRARTLPT